MTHVAFACDDPLVQAVLPQVIIGNEKTLLVGQLPAIRAACPPRVKILRRRSAWITAELFAQIVRWLGEALAPVAAGRHPILLFDACRMHLSSSVFRACAAKGIKPVVVPAQTTWLLQPLDTHAFYAYKAHLQKAYQSARIRSEGGIVGIAGLVASVVVSIDNVLCSRDWSGAFNDNGFSAGQAHVSARVVESLGSGVLPAVSAEKPTAMQLALCFPRRCRVPIAAIWAPPSVAVERGSSSGLRRSGRIAAAAAKAASTRSSGANSSLLAPPSFGGAGGSAPLGASAAVATSSSSSSSAGVAPKAKAVVGPITRSRARALASGP